MTRRPGRRFWVDGEEWEHTVRFLSCPRCFNVGMHVEAHPVSSPATGPPPGLLICASCEGRMAPGDPLGDDPP